MEIPGEDEEDDRQKVSRDARYNITWSAANKDRSVCL